MEIPSFDPFGPQRIIPGSTNHLPCDHFHPEILHKLGSWWEIFLNRRPQKPTTIQSLKSPMELYPDSGWPEAGQALGRELSSKAGLGTNPERGGGDGVWRDPPFPLLPSTLHSLPRKGTKSWQETGLRPPQAVCPAVLTSPGHKVFIYLGMETIVRHLGPSPEPILVGRRETGRVAVLCGPPPFPSHDLYELFS